MNHVYKPTCYHGTLGTHPEALRIAPGDSVLTGCVDADGRDGNDHRVSTLDNPMTGPFHIEGAEPGDTLAIRFERLTPSRALARSRAAIAASAVAASDDRRWPDGTQECSVAEWRLDLRECTATLLRPNQPLGRLRLSLAPMLGCFGVAPPGGQAISTATSGPYGGNMDYRGFGAGVTAYLPVFVSGALLFLGDGHALQGDGEITGSGLEISMDVEFTVGLHKGSTIIRPRGEAEDHIFTVGSGRPLEQALQRATTEMLGWLTVGFRMHPLDAEVLMGQCVEYDVANVVNPAYTVACKIAKRLLPASPLII